MFRRRRASLDFDPAVGPRADGPRDAALPMLSHSQALALAWLSMRWFYDTERSAEYDGAGSIVSDGARYGLTTLALTVAELPWPAWPQPVSDHFRALLAAEDEGQAPTLDTVFLKLRRAADVELAPDYPAESPLPGIYALVAHDTPTIVREFFQSAVLAPLGPLADVRARALANLRALPRPEHTVLSADQERSDADLHLFVGDDFFVASRVLLLDELLAATGVETPHGVLVAVPNRHLLCVHAPTGLGVVGALNLLTTMARREYDDSPGAVSFDVYYLPREGAAQIVTRHDADGTTSMVVDGALADTFAQLGLLEG